MHIINMVTREDKSTHSKSEITRVVCFVLINNILFCENGFSLQCDYYKNMNMKWNTVVKLFVFANTENNDSICTGK